MAPPPGAGNVVVVGGGLMGTGIAHAFVAAGHAVTLVDTRDAALAGAASAIGSLLDEGVRRGKLAAEDARAARGRLATSTDLAVALDSRPADLLLETASEDLAVKCAIVRDGGRHLPGAAIVATNTSALSVTEIAAAGDRPDRTVGMHFFNPVHKMRLVEVVRGMATSDETVALARAWSESLGKTSIVVNESPGLTTSRMSALMGNEAMHMLMSGVASAEDIDTAMRLGFNHPMGPLELGDLTGWDTRLAVLRYLDATLGDRFRPCPLIVKLVNAGRTGRKAGAGVYEYAGGERVPGSGLRVR